MHKVGNTSVRKHALSSVVLGILLVTAVACSDSGQTAKLGSFEDLKTLPKLSFIPYLDTETQLWGLAEPGPGKKIRVAPQYENVLYSPDGEVYLCQLPRKSDAEDLKHVLLDKTGKEIATLLNHEDMNPLRPDYYRDGYIVYWQKNKAGVMDIRGVDVVSPQYDKIELLGNGLAAGKIKDKWALLSLKDKGKELGMPEYDEITYVGDDGLIIAVKNGKYGFINTEGKEVISFLYDEVMMFHEGLAPVKLGKNWGYINKDGKEVIYPQYEFADVFSEGYARVKKDGSWGYIDKKGEYVISPRYSDATLFVKGIASVKLDKTWGVINTKGEFIIPPNYDKILRVIEHDLIALKQDDKWGFASYDGKILVSPRYDDYAGFGANGLAAVKIGEKWGYVDKTGKLVIPASFDKAFPFMPCTELALVESESKYNYINSQGKFIFKEGFDSMPFLDGGELENILKELSEELEGMPEPIVLERSHPLLARPELGVLYAIKNFGSLFCYWGTDMAMDETGGGFIDPQGNRYWKEGQLASKPLKKKSISPDEVAYLSKFARDVAEYNDLGHTVQKIKVGGKQIPVYSSGESWCGLAIFRFLQVGKTYPFVFELPLSRGFSIDGIGGPERFSSARGKAYLSTSDFAKGEVRFVIEDLTYENDNPLIDCYIGSALQRAGIKSNSDDVKINHLFIKIKKLDKSAQEQTTPSLAFPEYAYEMEIEGKAARQAFSVTVTGQIGIIKFP